MALSAILALSITAYAQPIEVNVKAQPLQSALNKLAEQTHTQVLVSQELVKDKESTALNGTMEPDTAFSSILKGSGLQASVKDGIVTITQSSESSETKTLEKITITGAQPTAKVKEGSAEAGYRATTAKKLGVWGDLPILDTPYTINEISEDMISNTNTVTSDQLVKWLPNAFQGFNQANNDLVGITARGYSAAFMLDGVRFQPGTFSSGVTLDDMERVELMPGFNGFLTGGNNVGGMLNLVLKRPTSYQFADVTAGYLGGSRYYTHLDTGGPLAGGKLGYRINISDADGETAEKGLSIHGTLYSGALDWHITNSVLLQLDAAHREQDQKGSPSMFNASSALIGNMITPPPADVAYSQDWEFWHRKTDRVGLALSADITDSLDFRSAYKWQRDTIDRLSGGGGNWAPSMTNAHMATLDPNDYSQWIISNPVNQRAKLEQDNLGGYGYLDYSFKTGALDHKLSFGYSTSISDSHAPTGNYKSLAYPASSPTVADPQVPAPAIFPDTIGPWYETAQTEYSNWVLGDQISFGKFIFMPGVNYTRSFTQNYNTTGATTGKYDKSKVTPNIALVYKATENISVYGNYVQALQNGVSVPATSGSIPYTNALQVLEPTTSEQYEFGIKANLDGLLLTSSVYQLNQANVKDITNSDGTLTKTQDGRQLNKGFEFTASGKATDRLALSGGFTFLNSKVISSQDKLSVGKTPNNVPDFIAKLYSEYRLPGIENLYLTGGANHVGKRYYSGDYDASDSGYTTYDLGARYEQKLYGYKTIFRLNVENLTDLRYWSQVGGYVQLGDPRTFTATVTVKF